MYRMLHLVAVFLLATAVAAADGQARPNILVIICDDLRYDALGVVQREQGERGRFPFFQTPGFDRLANEGVRLRNAFVVSSLCSPSRAVFLTGRYNHHNGIANNHSPFPLDSVTWATQLQQAGYTTGYIGKWHMGNQEERPGFTWSASYIGQGRYEDCPFLVSGTKQETTGWVDDVSTDFAIEFMRKHQGKPFALQIGYKTPHGPWTPPARAKERFNEVVARSAPNLNQPAIYSGKAAGPTPAATVPLGDNARNYFRCVSALDDNLTRLLTAMDGLNLTQNTLVVFTSDNGYYLGEHQLGDKRSMYDESLRIPLLMRLPGRIPAGSTSDAMALNLDLAPTLLELAGVPAPTGMQGRSLLGVAKGEPGPTWRQAFLYEYFFEKPYRIPSIVGVRTMTEKLITYPGHDQWREVFDLAVDPFELNNLTADPKHMARTQALMDLLAKEKAATGYHVPTNADRDEFDTLPVDAGKKKADKEK
jgi:arylsulfatase A-like enzyme